MIESHPEMPNHHASQISLAEIAAFTIGLNNRDARIATEKQHLPHNDPAEVEEMMRIVSDTQNPDNWDTGAES